MGAPLLQLCLKNSFPYLPPNQFTDGKPGGRRRHTVLWVMCCDSPTPLSSLPSEDERLFARGCSIGERWTSSEMTDPSVEKEHSVVDRYSSFVGSVRRKIAQTCFFFSHPGLFSFSPSYCATVSNYNPTIFMLQIQAIVNNE